MKTVNEIAIKALQLIGIYSVDEMPDTYNTTSAIDMFGMVIDSLSAQGVTIPYFSAYSFPFMSGKAEYTFGLDGASDFAVSPFVEIETIYFLFSGVQYPITVISHGQRDGLGLYQALQGLPTNAVLQRTSLNCSLNFYPVPNAAYQCTVRAKGKLIAEDNQQVVVSVPSEHYLFISMLLAKYLSFIFPTADWSEAKEGELSKLMSNYTGSADIDLQVNVSNLLQNNRGFFDRSSIYRGF